MRTIARCFLLFGLVALVPRVAAAQATLAGEVKDTTGAVLPGVTVEAASPALTEKVRTAVTDGSGLALAHYLVACRPELAVILLADASWAADRRIRFGQTDDRGSRLGSARISCRCAASALGCLEWKPY